MSRRTIYTGIGELEAMGNEDHPPPQRPRGGAKRIRRPVSGRRQVTQRQPGLGEVVDEVLEAHRAGSPTDEAVRWTDLEPVQLALARGYHISRNTAAKLLARPGYRRRYAQQILLTFDAGAANVARSLRFKEDLVALSRRFGRRLRVALYSPYTSKRHPIEHRLFCHVARRLSGVILDSHQTALNVLLIFEPLLSTIWCGRRNIGIKYSVEMWTTVAESC